MKRRETCADNYHIYIEVYEITQQYQCLRGYAYVCLRKFLCVYVCECACVGGGGYVSGYVCIDSLFV